MSLDANLNLLGAYLDILIDGCRRKQYERVEMLLPGAIYDAEFHEILDPRLVSILRELFDYYLSINNKARASAVMQQLVAMSENLESSDCAGAGPVHLDLRLDRLTLMQLRSEKAPSLAVRLELVVEQLKASVHRCIAGAESWAVRRNVVLAD